MNKLIFFCKKYQVVPYYLSTKKIYSFRKLYYKLMTFICSLCILFIKKINIRVCPEINT